MLSLDNIGTLRASKILAFYNNTTYCQTALAQVVLVFLLNKCIVVLKIVCGSMHCDIHFFQVHPFPVSSYAGVLKYAMYINA